ncbi:MAG: hypothetical protein Q9213_001734 [Squamulea squamosa]
MESSKRRKLNGTAESPATAGTAMSPKKYDNICFGENPMVDLKVGAEETLFHVHKGLICDASPFFEAAFTGRFKENSGSITLTEDNVNAFEHIVQWLYRRNLGTLSEGKVNKAKNTILIEVYILADKYHIVPLQNAIIDQLCTALKSSDDSTYRGPRISHVKHVYENTVHGSRLRRFLVGHYAWTIKLKWFANPRIRTHLQDVPEFAADLAIAFAMRQNGAPDPFLNRASFHEPPTE